MFVWGLGVESANPMSSVFFTAKSHRGSAARNRSPLLLVLKPHFFWMGDQHGKQDRLWSKTQASELCATRWCPSSLAKLVQITPITTVYDIDISVVNGVYKPTYNWGAPHCSFNFTVSRSLRRGLRLCSPGRFRRGIFPAEAIFHQPWTDGTLQSEHFPTGFQTWSELFTIFQTSDVQYIAIWL